MPEHLYECPALFIAAPASGQGKTTVTAALARYHSKRGTRVRVFKTGPDFLDPLLLERASGARVQQLDLWMGGEAHCRELLHAAAAEADLILIEGVMGLFDGDRSSADLARLFRIPILAVINAGAMAQTFGALAYGLAHYQCDLPFAGVFANRVSSDTHYLMLLESLSDDIPLYGRLPKDENIALPERHLGLVQAEQIADLDARIDRAAELLVGADEIVPPTVRFSPSTPPILEPLLAGQRIAIARDAAFAFLYHANLDTLRAMGAELCFFSPITDSALPQADALYLPGGYPELHLPALAANTQMHDSIRAHHAAGKPLLAECGGMLYLSEALHDVDGERTELVGLLPGEAYMQKRLGNLGLHKLDLNGAELRGHSFHYSRYDCPLPAAAISEGARAGRRGEALYRIGALTATYMHFYFPCNPTAVASLLRAKATTTSTEKGLSHAH